MRLASNETTITMGEAKVTLRPSLRAAYRLLPGDGALLALLNGISAFDTAVVSRIIRESATKEDEAEHFISAMLYGSGLAYKHAAFADSLVQHVLALLGNNDLGDKPASTEPAAKVSITAYLEELFSIGTGWLHWTPEATWQATPGEILAAHAGHMKMLRLLHGSSEPASNEPHWDRDEKGFADLKAMAERARR